MERVERELARVRRELNLPTVTDTVMAEVVGQPGYCYSETFLFGGRLAPAA